MQPDPAVLLHDEHRGRLHAALVAARRLAGLERREQPERQRPRGALEGGHHAVHHAGTRENVALRRAMAAELVPGPPGRLGGRGGGGRRRAAQRAGGAGGGGGGGGWGGGGGGVGGRAPHKGGFGAPPNPR